MLHMVFALSTLLPHAVAMNNGLARTPPMGWSSWNCFGGRQSQERMTTIAQAMVSTGLRDLGYTNLAIDGGWESFMHGGPPASGSKGPNGWDFRNLSEYFHSLDLKLGMYIPSAAQPSPATACTLQQPTSQMLLPCWCCTDPRFVVLLYLGT
jgi:hypothetical protein